MLEAWRLILLFIPLIAGGISIYFSFRLMKRYRISFTSSFFYYLVFLYIFGTYSLAGAGILGHLLSRMEIDLKVIHSAGLYAIFLGIPFLALSHFMFLRSVMEFFRKKPGISFTIIYFLGFTAAFILYGINMVRLTRFELGDYQDLIRVQRWVFFAFILIFYFSACVYILLSSAKISDLPAKRHFRIFGAWYLVYMILALSALALSSYGAIFRQLFLMIFLSWHLIPILYINVYLNKFQEPASALPVDFESSLRVFAKKHDISKREVEVVRLICRGFSNQEISETLFISLQTVKDHTHRIFVKTGVRNRVQLSNMIR